MFSGNVPLGAAFTGQDEKVRMMCKDAGARVGPNLMGMCVAIGDQAKGEGPPNKVSGEEAHSRDREVIEDFVDIKANGRLRQVWAIGFGVPRADMSGRGSSVP